MKGVLRRRQLLQFIGLSNTTQWRLEKNGEFPARIKLGAEGDVPEFLELLLLCDTIDECQGQLASTLKVCFSM